MFRNIGDVQFIVNNIKSVFTDAKRKESLDGLNSFASNNLLSPTSEPILSSSSKTALQALKTSLNNFISTGTAAAFVFTPSNPSAQRSAAALTAYKAKCQSVVNKIDAVLSAANSIDGLRSGLSTSVSSMSSKVSTFFVSLFIHSLLDIGGYNCWSSNCGDSKSEYDHD